MCFRVRHFRQEHPEFFKHLFPLRQFRRPFLPLFSLSLFLLPGLRFCGLLCLPLHGLRFGGRRIRRLCLLLPGLRFCGRRIRRLRPPSPLPPFPPLFPFCNLKQRTMRPSAEGVHSVGPQTRKLRASPPLNSELGAQPLCTFHPAGPLPSLGRGRGWAFKARRCLRRLRRPLERASSRRWSVRPLQPSG